VGVSDASLVTQLWRDGWRVFPLISLVLWAICYKQEL
jgi:hypothetical protein